MDSVEMHRCPDCSALVPLPADLFETPGRPGERHLDQIARALCGCWATRLSEGRAVDLACAIMAGDEVCNGYGSRAPRGGS